MGFQVARITGSFVVMEMGKDGFLKRGIRGYIDTVFVGENSLSMLPVREMGAKGGRDEPIHQLECLKDKGIRGRGGLDTIGEGSINEVDKE